MSVELIPNKAGQHVVTFVPKVTTDLPFFNLTYRKKDITNKIKFESIDTAGNPIHWEVRHNTDDDIGYAGVQAHEVWYLLIKPAIDASRMASGKIPEIIPLGGVRECLRMVGWTQGGHQAKDFIRALTQISFAGIIADLWFPTGEIDDDGQPKFRQMKGRFSRMSVYAIGEQHLTQEQLKEADISFDLEDTVYIKLDAFEVMLQEAQAEKQRLIDNQYMFSVKPVARRWYELMAGKVFGTLKHKKDFFEIKYSWYVKHHHNLKKFYKLGSVTRQMNQVVGDHIKSGFLKKVEYRKYKEADQELDFIIRYYVGQTAQESINRIKGYILNRDRKRNIEVKRANKKPQIGHPEENRSDIPFEEEMTVNLSNLPSEHKSEGREDLAFLDTVTDEHRELIKTLIVQYQISAKKAHKLVVDNKDECKKQIEALPFREVEMKNRAGFLIKAIESSYSLPEEYIQNLEEVKKQKSNKIKKQTIADCSICPDNGMREISTGDPRYPSGMKKCTHDAEIEKQFADYQKQ